MFWIGLIIFVFCVAYLLIEKQKKRSELEGELLEAWHRERDPTGL